MRWDGKKMKILRLSLFNLRKNKREAAAIVFLTMVTVFLLGTAFISITKLGDIFNKAYDETGCMDYIIHFRKDSYREVYKVILEEEYGIEDSVEANGLFAIPLNVMEKNGGKQLHNFGFISLETEKKRKASTSRTEDLMMTYLISNTQSGCPMPLR